MARKDRQDDHDESQTPWQRYQEEVKARQAEQKPKHHWFKRPDRISDKLPKLKKQRHHFLMVKMGSLLAVFGIIFVVSGYFISPLSHISSVAVSGNHYLSNRAVVAASELTPGTSLTHVLTNSQKLSAKANKNNPRIAKVSASLDGLNHVKLSVKEYKTAAYMQKNGKYHIIFENGHIDPQVQQHVSSSVAVFSDFPSTKVTKQMIDQYNKLDEDIRGGVSEIHFSPVKSDPLRIHVFMNDGNEVYAAADTFSNKMMYYPGIAQKMKQNGVINLEVGAYSYPFKNSKKSGS